MSDLQADLQRVVDRYRRASRIVRAEIQRVWDNLRRIFTRALDPRIAHGPDMFDDDGHWQSTMCGAWLHDSCGLPDRCECRCHGGTLR